jgi:hypothetical protein
MEHSRAAEQALVTALVLGEADPRDLTGRVRVSDVTDPAAAVLFEAALHAEPTRPVADQLPVLLRREGRLRSDGYPIGTGGVAAPGRRGRRSHRTLGSAEMLSV